MHMKSHSHNDTHTHTRTHTHVHTHTNTPTRPENRSPVWRQIQRRTYKTRNRSPVSGDKYNDTPTRPENRSPVCETNTTTHLQDQQVPCVGQIRRHTYKTRTQVAGVWRQIRRHKHRCTLRYIYIIPSRR